MNVTGSLLDLDPCYPSAFFSCWYFGYLLFCLGWIVACWDITLNSCLPSSILICSVSIVIAECPRNPSNIYTWCCFSHLMRRFTDDSWCEASFENLTICFLLCSVPCFFLLCFGYSLSLDRVQCIDGGRGATLDLRRASQKNGQRKLFGDGPKQRRKEKWVFLALKRIPKIFRSWLVLVLAGASAGWCWLVLVLAGAGAG